MNSELEHRLTSLEVQVKYLTEEVHSLRKSLTWLNYLLLTTTTGLVVNIVILIATKII